MRLICWMKGILKCRPVSDLAGSALIGVPTGLPNSVMKTCSVSLTVKALLEKTISARKSPAKMARMEKRFMVVSA